MAVASSGPDPRPRPTLNRSNAAGPVALVGMDGADWAPIRSLLSRGRLPILAKLIDSGVSGTLQSLDVLMSPRIWTSVATGKLPGKHGIWDFRTPQTDLRAKRLWEIVQDAGGSAGAFQWMGLWPPEPGPLFNVPTASQCPDGQAIPPSLGFLGELFGVGRDQYKSRSSKLAQASSLAWRAWRHGVRLSTLLELGRAWTRGPGEDASRGLAWYARAKLAQMRMDTDIYAWLIRRYRPDFSAALMPQTDNIQHRAWGETVLEFPEEAGGDWGPTVEATYIRADECLGRLIDTLPENATIAIVSDHGFQAEPARRWLLLDEILDRTGLRDLARVTRGEAGKACVRPLPGPDGAALSLSEVHRRLLGLRVSPRDEPLLHCETRSADVITSCPAERWSEDEIDGQRVGMQGSSETILLSDMLSSPDRPWVGAHSPSGIMIMSGPAVRLGEKLAEPPSVLDIAPTLLHTLGLPIGEDMDGRVLTEALMPAWLDRHPIRTTPSYGRDEPGDAATPSDDEVAAIEERLRALGYLD